MARHDYDDYYDSDDSTLVNSPPHDRRRRPRARSLSEDPYAQRPRYSRSASSPGSRYSQRGEPEPSTASKLGKVALGAIFVTVVARAFNSWIKKKEEEREKERLREKRRQFEKAKVRRRREEDRRERQRQERMRREAAEHEVSEVSARLRIGYMPAKERDRSRSRQPRSLEAPTERDADDQDEFDERRKTNRSRSRPAVDVT